MDPSSLRSLSSILARNKPASKDSLSALAGRLAEEPLATVYTKPKVSPPSGYTIDDEEEQTPAPKAYAPIVPPPPGPVADPDEDEEDEETFSAPASIPLIGSPPQSIGLGELKPPTPESIEHTGLSAKLIEQLIVKMIYYRGQIVGHELAAELGLQFSVIDGIMDQLKSSYHIIVRSSLGMGMISSRFELTDSGRTLAREYIETSAYSGKAPVPLFQYVDIVRRQKQRDSWLNMDMLKDCYKHMVVTDQILNQVGPAVNAGKSFLIYGMPGNGKTYLAEALNNLDKTMIYIPYAIEAQGMIIQLYDPLYHTPEDTTADEPSSMSNAGAHDRRWFRSRRPFIVSGGELTLDTLDLSYNSQAKSYDAPLHMKANNGIYLIDDFGRQKVTPAEVLNRWIIPMERRVDFLSFQNGTKMHVPFEVFLVFSTNLKPDDLGDEAFLRRIQYKMLMRSPDDFEFASIFKRFAESQNLPTTPKLIVDFINRQYRKSKKAKRRCQPRDILTHAIDIIRFERREWELTPDVLDKAFESCFVQVDEEM